MKQGLISLSLSLFSPSLSLSSLYLFPISFPHLPLPNSLESFPTPFLFPIFPHFSLSPSSYHLIFFPVFLSLSLALISFPLFLFPTSLPMFLSPHLAVFMFSSIFLFPHLFVSPMTLPFSFLSVFPPLSYSFLLSLCLSLLPVSLLRFSHCPISSLFISLIAFSLLIPLSTFTRSSLIYPSFPYYLPLLSPHFPSSVSSTYPSLFPVFLQHLSLYSPPLFLSSSFSLFLHLPLHLSPFISQSLFPNSLPPPHFSRSLSLGLSPVSTFLPHTVTHQLGGLVAECFLQAQFLCFHW